MPLPAEHTDLVAAAMLSANSFALERTQNVVAELRRANLLEPAHVCGLETEALVAQLVGAGYDRGRLTPMFATRLQALLAATQDGTLDELPTAVATGDESQVVALLTRVKGIGPSVARTAWILLRAVFHAGAHNEDA